MGHRSGPSVIGTDVPVVAVSGSSSSVDSRVGEVIGGTDGPGLDPVNATEFHVANMLQWSRLLTSTETPPCIPHPASRPIDFRIGAIGLQIATDTSFDPADPDQVNNAADQLWTLSLS